MGKKNYISFQNYTRRGVENHKDGDGQEYYKSLLEDEDIQSNDSILFDNKKKQ